MARMIASDLDGTLLTTDKRITAYTQKVLKECHDQNIRIVLATARPWRAVAPYLKEIPVDGVIFHNGSTITVGEKVLGCSNRIPRDRVQKILHGVMLDYPSKRLSVEMNDTLYANFPVSYYWSYTEGISTDFSDLPAGDADKIIVEINSEAEFQRVIQNLTDDEYGQICEGQLCLIMHKNASKLNGIRALCEHWNISLDSVIAFGDDHNDLEMITQCGVGVAMANGISLVQEAADMITAANDEAGVADWLERHILKAF